MRTEITLDKYVKFYQGVFDKKYPEFDIEDVWEYYHNNIFPYLSIISQYRQENTDKCATHKQIQMALFINKDYWKICKSTFKGLKSALNGKAVRMDIMVQAQLVKEIINNPNGKYIQMGLERWDDGYKPKGESTTIEMPETLKVEYRNVKKSDEELEAHAKKFD